ncbi:cyclase [Pelomonas aquatica]|uniref:imidazole glycerol-phosphate synthase n=1 Tax=Pelomonas aquatica TaxID=431058 RepID=A0ABU1Z5C0_9BURK|nr:AglZ/HisF2 family acetamidino modification protein [Pelomonas aquatica]MDR7295807.1 cyclase [Pelomonas aquatica]
MLKNRVIPTLLLRDGGLIKTHKFKNPKYVGDCVNAIRIFNEKEVDELIVLDIYATRERRRPDFETIGRIAEECFMPLCYGGGVSTLEDASRIYQCGVEKISLQTAALRDPGLVTEIARKYGSQAVVVSIDVKKDWLGRRKVYASDSGKLLDEPLPDVLRRLVDAGAGEVLINAVDRDGDLCGYDFTLVSEVSGQVSVPVIASGGAASLEDFKMAVNAGASAVAAGAYFVFHGPHRAVLITYPKYEELERTLGVKS